MTRSRISLRILALAATASLALTACGSGGGTTPGTTTSAAGETTGGEANAAALITANGSEPENPLIPTNTNEVGGGRILDSIFAGLYYYDGKGAPQKDLATSVETTDSITFTVKIRNDSKFTDGTTVKAENFVKAWNYGAALDNAQLNSSWFEDIEGYTVDKNVAELSGLKVVDDTTFTVKLTKAVADFPLRLGYSAYYPLPDSAFADMAAFGQNPVGNGPYKLGGADSWKHDEQIDLVTNADYNGPRKPANGGLTFKFYASQDAGYADLLGDNVDVLDGVPAAALSTFESDLGDRAVNQPSAVFQSFTIPESLDHFGGEEGKLRRQALSMAINRDEITKVIFFGTRTPASDFTSPVIAGWSDKLAGADVLKYDQAKAKELWAKADAIAPWSGTFEIAYNSDGGHQAWVDAVTNSIKNTLGIEAAGAPYATFKELRSAVNQRTIKTAFRTGWQADYPGLYNFLAPLYATGASSNDSDYTNADFDKLLQEGQTQADAAAANKFFQQSQEILLKDLPSVPLWYSNVTGGYSKNVSNVVFGWNSVPLYYEITAK